MQNKETGVEKLSAEETEKVEKEINSAINASIKNGRLDLIVFPNTKTVAALYIIKNQRGDRVFFTSAVPRKLVYVEEAKDQRLPEIYVNSEYLSTEIIARNIRGFLHDHYENIENLPISLYGSRKKFLEKKLLVEIENPIENPRAA